MSNIVVFRKGRFIVDKSSDGFRKFWTVVNSNPETEHDNKRDFHCHVPIYNFNSAKMICVWAYRIKDCGKDVWPSHYSEYMQRGLRKVLTGKFDEK